MSNLSFGQYTIPSLAARSTGERPVLSQDQITTLSQRIMAMTAADTATITVSHTVRTVTRFANGQVLSSDDGDRLEIMVRLKTGAGRLQTIQTNQLDDRVLRTLVQQCERLARESIEGAQGDVRIQPHHVPDPLVPVHLWHEETIRAMTTAREPVLSALLLPVRRMQLNAAGFVGLMARAEACISRDGNPVYSEETDSEVTVTARTRDGKSSGWGGQAARNWSTIDTTDVAAHAVQMATIGGTPVVVEPGRRTAILSPTVVAQLIRVFADEYPADVTDEGWTGFSRMPRGNKLRQRVFDSRINMTSDPADSEGGYRPYFYSGSGTPYGTPVMQWVKNGVLENLAYNPEYALARGKPYADIPTSVRVSGGPTSLEQMIAHCDDGIYVNRVSGTHLEDQRTGLTTGVTCDGCFLVRNGKIEKAAKNFRFLESPFALLNNITALGLSQRAALGYIQPRDGQDPWPLPPIIVPPIMVRDFNFSSLIDAI